MEALEKKKEREDILAQETQTIAKAQAKANPIKVTRAQITEMQERREEIARGKADRPEPETHLTAPLVENVNRLVLISRWSLFSFVNIIWRIVVIPLYGLVLDLFSL